MVLLPTYASHGAEQRRQQCDTGKNSALCASSDVLNVKFKRPEVYAIRDFPKGLEQPGAQTTFIQNKPLCSVGTFGNLLGKKDSTDDSKDYSVKPFEIDAVYQQISVHSEMHDLYNDLESMVETIVASDSEEVVESPKVLDDAKFIIPLKALELKNIGLIDSMNCIGGLEAENVLEDEAQTQIQMDELSSLKMRRGTSPKIYFPRRGVSAIRCFPPGCGSHAANLSKDDCLKDVASSKNRGSGCQKSIVRKHEDNVGVSEGKGKMEHLMTDMVETDTKLSGESALMNQLLRVERPIGSDRLAGRVVVQALMAEPRCPWRHIKRAFKSNSSKLPAGG